VKYVSERWSVENGCLTAAMKLNRTVVLRRYQKDIDEMLAACEFKCHDPSSSSHIELSVDNLCDVLSRRIRSNVCADDTVDDVKFLGQDSLSIMSLLHDIRSTFALPSLTPNHWFSSGTISNFVSNIKRLNFLTSKDGFETIPAQVEQDTAELLQDFRIETMQFAYAELCTDAAVLLTGVTGFLGAHLLEELLKQSCSRLVYCIIRSGNAGAEHCHERLVSTLFKYKISLSSSQMTCVRVLAGDVAQPQFGLSLEDYQSLSQEVGCVYHNASEVNWLMTYSQLRASNVLGTLHALKFASCGRSKWFHYVSTLNTSDFGSLSLLEKPLAGNGYQQSKWVAERLVHQAALRGLNATIYRPGTIGPHSSTGACNVTDYSSCFMLSIAQYGIYLDSNSEFEMSPVDCVANAIVVISTQKMLAVVQPLVSTSTDYVSSASSLSDIAPSASPRCANLQYHSRTSSNQSTGLAGSPRIIMRAKSASNVPNDDWQKKNCFNLSHCSPIMSNQDIGSLICESLHVHPTPVGPEAFYR
jgi:thioester reductase-like protein